ncbi:Pathogenesis-related protein 1 [Melia azedarach]|uniref:Pathogenesis-related protein 1 n=1 Tax=Melia azedarach TaxID=155640 RepID=A0ACC1XZF6_MELAZ|nr:Pathogenesis-related protein 1 [Melia azedarach]
MWFNKFFLAIYLISLTPSKIIQAQSSHQDFVNAHNAARAEVGVGPITWNDSVAAYAQDYADHRIGDCNLDHSMGPYGENLAEGYGKLDGVDAVKMWVSEKPNYDYASNSCVGDECLHYTQIIWRKSVSLGCGRVKCHNGWWFVICSYYPPGNIEGERPY